MSFAKDSIRTFIVRSTIIGVNITVGIIYARWLGPEGVGTIALFALMHNFALRFGNLGFGSGLSFFIARGKTTGREMLISAFVITGLISLVSSLILIAIWKASFSPWRDMSPEVFYISLFAISPFVLHYFLSMMLSGHLDIKATNISEVIMVSCNIPLVVISVIILKLGIAGALCSNVMSECIVVCYLYSRIKKKKAHGTFPDRKVNRINLLKDIWHYGRWNYLVLFFNFYVGELPIMVLSYFYPYKIVGFFSMGRGLMEKTRILPSSFAQVLFPYTAASEEKVAVNRTNILCRNFMMINSCMIVVLVFVAKPLVVLLYGEAFLPVVPVFYALIPAILLWPLSQFLAVHVAGFGNPKKVLMRSLIALPGCVIACFIFIPIWGAVGAALSVSVAYLILAAVSIYIYKKSTGAQLSEILILRG